MDDEALRTKLRHIFFRAAGGISDMANEEIEATIQLIKQDRETTRLVAQFDLCRDLIAKNHDGTQINWSTLGGDVANMKINLAQQLTTNSEAEQ